MATISDVFYHTESLYTLSPGAASKSLTQSSLLQNSQSLFYHAIQLTFVTVHAKFLVPSFLQSILSNERFSIPPIKIQQIRKSTALLQNNIMKTASDPSSANAGKMECLLVDLKNHRLNLTECPIPTIGANDEPSVIVEVVLSGLCGTDLHIVEVRTTNIRLLITLESCSSCTYKNTLKTFKGKFPSADAVVLGHEFIGYVHETAKEEKVFKKGDRVAIMPNLYVFVIVV